MDFKCYPEGKWWLTDKESKLKILSKEGVKEKERLSPEQASKILGVWISPDGSSNEQTIQLHQISASWADKVRSGHIKKKDSWYYFQRTVRKLLELSLISTSMNDK